MAKVLGAENAFVRPLRTLQALGYAALMKLLSANKGREAKAIAPFETRFWFHIKPLKGRDSYLFHRDHDVLEQLAGDVTFRARQIDVWIRALKSRQAWCAANDSVMRVLLIPEKHVVYADKLPFLVAPTDRRPALQVLAAARSDATLAGKLLYPLETLRAARAQRQTYFKTDTHWNSYGAFVAYRALVDSLAPEIRLERVEEKDLVWTQRPYVGDIGVRFAEERGETAETAEPTATYKLVFHNHNFGRGAVHVYENERRDLPTCVLFRDSFSNFLVPYLMRGFSRLVAVSSLTCQYDLLNQERPDVVLFVTIERFLATFGRGLTIELPEDELAHSFESLSGTALKAVRRTSG